MPTKILLTSQQEYGQHHGEHNSSNSDHCTLNGPVEDLWSDQLYHFEDKRKTDKNVSDGQVEDVNIRWCLKVANECKY